MRLTKRQLKRLIENVLNEADKTDPGVGQEIDQDKTESGESYVDQQMSIRGIQPQPKPDDSYDRAKLNMILIMVIQEIERLHLVLGRKVDQNLLQTMI